MVNKKSKPAAPVAKFRFRVTVGEVAAIGPGKVALLEAIGESGSLTAAAKHLGMSYRRAWLLLDELNQSLRKPAVESVQGGSRGGGSVLTAAGREIVETYRRIERTAAIACAADIKVLLRLLVK
jgi:molybdate transport system regulatory protein